MPEAGQPSLAINSEVVAEIQPGSSVFFAIKVAKAKTQRYQISCSWVLAPNVVLKNYACKKGSAASMEAESRLPLACCSFIY